MNKLVKRYYDTCLAHHGVKGQKWGIQNGPPYPIKKSIEKSDDCIRIEDTYIHKSVGAKSKNYDIYDPESNEYFHFVEGTWIRNSKVFAGKGCKNKLDDEVTLGLSEQIGGNPEEWQHCKGIGTIDYHGEEIDAEVHWFQEPSVGKHKFKVKKWLE